MDASRHPMHNQPHVHVIATQHLDVAYLWRRQPDGEAVMRQCFERVVEIMEAHPDVHFVFSRSTAWSFYTMETKHPDLFEQIKQYVGLDRIELCGGQWVEPDNVLPDGETLVRQSLYGQHYFRSRFGKQATAGWNPDAFAHGNTLPQILSKSGLEGYYFHRCQPLDAGGEVITQFIWEGLDGSRVFALCGKWRGKPGPAELKECAAEMDRTGLPMSFVVTGANSDRQVTIESDWVPALQAAGDAPGLPPARWALAGDVLDDMRSYAHRLPVVKGNLGFQFTGTYTSEGNIKRWNRRMEALLADAEKASVCAMLLGRAYPHAALTGAWRDLCVNTFHDIICGTCYQHVHEEALDLYRAIEEQGRRIREDALQFIVSQADTELQDGAQAGRPFLLLNTLSWPLSLPVTIPLSGDEQDDPRSKEIVTRDGKVVPSQAITLEDGSRGITFVPPNGVPAFAHTTFVLRDALLPATPEPAQTLCLENETLLAEIDPDTGALSRLFDKASSTDLLAPHSEGNRLVFYEDQSELSNYEPWYIGYTGATLDGGRVERVRLVEAGPVRTCIRVERKVSLHPALPATEIVQDIVLYSNLPYLVFQTRGNWQAERVLLKAEFDLAFSCMSIACDMPYGVVERKPHRGQTAFRIGRDAAGEDGIRIGTTVEEPDRPMQKWLDFSDGARGVAFLNNGRYGYDASARQVRISLLRAPVHRDGERVGLGRFSFAYALMPHRGDWREARLPQHGYAFNHELVPVFSSPHEGLALEGKSFYSIRDPHVLIAAAKRSEVGSGIVLRLYESYGQHTATTLSSAKEIARVAVCDLLEEPLPDQSGCRQLSRHAVDVSLGPFEIKTLLLQHGGDCT